jgi:hypothetical protein
MKFKEHLQFLLMMIPTMLLLIAAVVTFATPAKAAQQQPGQWPHESTVLTSETAAD